MEVSQNNQDAGKMFLLCGFQLTSVQCTHRFNCPAAQQDILVLKNFKMFLCLKFSLVRALFYCNYCIINFVDELVS
jgi:hypothetical protein